MVESTSHTFEVRRPSTVGWGWRTHTIPDAFATSTAAATDRICSVSSLSISSTTPALNMATLTSSAEGMNRASPGAQEGYESLIGVLVAQCAALLVGPHTKLSYGLKTKNATA